MAKTTKKQEVERLQKLSELKDQRMAALEDGNVELAAELKAKIAALESGKSAVSAVSAVDLEKVNITFDQLGEVYQQFNSNEYRSNSETTDKPKAGEVAKKLGFYTLFDDALFGAFCGLVKVCALFNGKGTNVKAYNMLKAKVFDNVKNFEPLHAELVKLVGDSAKRENIKDYKELSLMAKGYKGAMAILNQFVNMPKTDTEPTKEQAEPTKEQAEPTKEQAEPTKEQAEPTKEQAEPTKEQAEPTKEDKKGKGKGKK